MRVGPFCTSIHHGGGESVLRRWPDPPAPRHAPITLERRPSRSLRRHGGHVELCVHHTVAAAHCHGGGCATQIVPRNVELSRSCALNGARRMRAGVEGGRGVRWGGRGAGEGSRGCSIRGASTAGTRECAMQGTPMQPPLVAGLQQPAACEARTDRRTTCVAVRKARCYAAFPGPLI